MPQTRSIRKTKLKKNKQQRGPINPPLSVTKYTGPGRMPQYYNGSLPYVFEISYGTNIVSTGAGLVQYLFSSDPSPGSLENPYPGFALLSPIFRDFRILVSSFQYTPNVDGGTPTGVNPGPLAVAVDRSVNTLPASYADADKLQTVYHSLNTHWRVTVRMAQVEEADMRAMSSGGPYSQTLLYYLKLFANNTAVSTTYGRILIKSIIQCSNPYAL